MLLDSIPIQEITKEKLMQLIEDRVPEDKHIEYKEKLPCSNEEKKEFLRDVTAFANTQGGHLIYGVKEEDRRPIDLCGIHIDGNLDTSVQSLDHFLRDGVEPRLFGYQIYPVLVKNENYFAFVIRVSKSFNPPHKVKLGDDRFYCRNSSGRDRLDVGQLRQLFLISDTFAKQAREFRAERLMRIQSKDLQIPFIPGLVIVLHIIPFDAFVLEKQYDLSLYKNKSPLKQTNLPIMSSMSHSFIGSIFNLDGYCSYIGTMNCIIDESKGTKAYTQLFRNGIIEGVCMPSMDQQPILNLNYKDTVINFTKEIIPILQNIEVNLPIVLMLSLLNTKGFRLSCINHYGSEDVIDSYLPYKNNELILPEIIIESKEENIGEKLHPIFNIVRNALGLEPINNTK